VVTEDVKPKPVVQEVIQQEVIKKPPLAPRIREEAKTRARENTLKNQEPAEIDRRHDTKVKLLESFFPALSAVFSGEDFSKEILRKIVAALECDSGYLLQFDTQSQRLFPIASENILGEIVKRIDKSGIKPDPVLGKTLDRRSPFLVPFLDWKTALKKRLFGENPFASAMMISIRSENGIWGILILCHRTQIFTQKELKLLEFIGEKISFLLETMTHWESLSKKVETMAMAQELGRSIAKGGSVVVSTLLNGIKTLMRASNCYLLLLDEQKNLLYGVAASHHAPEGISEVEIRMEEHGVVPLTVKQNHYMVIENALSDVRVGKKWVDHFRSRSLMSVPLVARERVMGVLLIDETAYFRPFTEIEIETVVGLAPSAAIAIDMAMKYQESLQRQERQDHISMSVFQTHEQECKKMSRSFGNGTGTLLEQARKQIQSAGETLSLEKMDTRKQLESACLTLDKAVLELERLSSEMFPNKLEDHGLISALKEATALFSKSTGVSVQFNAPTAIKSISPKLELHLYRIVSEALQNVHQHAHAKSLVLSIEKKDIYLHLSITDQGRGFDTRRYFALPQNKRKGVGILGMKCRIELFGGTFFIESAQEQGTRISIKVPLLRAGTGVQ
jgi:signal transduction histidine kinase